jgi:hypothetical protein
MDQVTVEAMLAQEEIIFDKKIYDELGRQSLLLYREANQIDTLRAKMAHKCIHPTSRQKTGVENRYTTTRCLDCNYVLTSIPLPGVEYDRD